MIPTPLLAQAMLDARISYDDYVQAFCKFLATQATKAHWDFDEYIRLQRLGEQMTAATDLTYLWYITRMKEERAERQKNRQQEKDTKAAQASTSPTPPRLSAIGRALWPEGDE